MDISVKKQKIYASRIFFLDETTSGQICFISDCKVAFKSMFFLLKYSLNANQVFVILISPHFMS